MVEKTTIDNQVYFLYTPEEHEEVELLREIVSTTRELLED